VPDFPPRAYDAGYGRVFRRLVPGHVGDGGRGLALAIGRARRRRAHPRLGARLRHDALAGRQGAVVRASLVGAPLPLCSCGVIPAAVGLRRGGASRGATVSFLISTPETGVDSVAVSYVLLGPLMAVARPVAAVATALLAGGIVSATTHEDETPAPDTPPTPAPIGRCNTTNTAPGVGDIQDDTNTFSTINATTDACADACAEPQPLAAAGPIPRTLAGLAYAASDLVDDLKGWLLLGIVLAGLLAGVVDEGQIAAWGSGLPAMGLMLLVGVPMYICATASTPIAAALLLAGVSPGTVLVFLLAGPATNLATMGVVRKELGTPTLGIYLAAIAAVAVALGLALDALVHAANLDIVAQAKHTAHLIPHGVGVASLVVLVLCSVRAIRRPVLGR
jgi:hypothetical protein